MLKMVKKFALNYKNMKTFSLKIFIFYSCFLLQIIIVFCNSLIENQAACELYYLKKNSIVCVTQYAKNYSTRFKDSVILDTMCRNANSRKYIKPLVINSTASSLNFINCSVRPGIFQYMYLPDTEVFTLGPNSRHPVLKNNTFRGLCSVRRMYVKGNDIQRIGVAAFKCVKSITLLDLSENKLHSLSRDVFKEMRLLENLELNNNNFSAFPEEIFDSLVSLKFLHLHYNSIRNLPDLIFKNLNHLHGLTLNNNNLQSLSKRLLWNLTKLSSLDLSYNKLKSIEGRFPKNNEMMNLNLAGNVGLSLTNDSFFGMQKLNALNLENCGITFIPNAAFSNLTQLRILRLSGNILSEVNSEIFLDFRDMFVLDLSFNNIADFKVQTFTQNKGLSCKLKENHRRKRQIYSFLEFASSLDLSSNNLTTIESSLSGLTELHKLNISNNFITHLHKSHPFHSFLSSLTELIVLDISNNKIRSLTNVFFNNAKILRLDISKNPQLVLSKDSFNGLSDLKMLSINYCDITLLPRDIFINTPRLNYLTLHDNNLKQIDSEMFKHLKNLKVLDVSSNGIFSLSDEPFKHNNNLRLLYIFLNDLRVIKRGDFTGLSSLKRLDISQNIIEKIENVSFAPLAQLDFLNISHNLVSSLRDIVRHCDNLREMDISYNRLGNIEDRNWHKLLSFESIVASNNMVEKLYLSLIPKATIHLERNNVKRIYLSEENEEVTSLPQKEIKTQIFLSGNPIECDCYSYKFYENLMDGSSLTHVEFVDNLICENPTELRGKILHNLNASHFVCNVTQFCPENCMCKYSAYNGVTALNCSDKDYKYLPLEVPTNTNVLYIKRNNLISLMQLNEIIWENLTEIYADGNELVYEEFYIPKQLKYLGLSENKLRAFPNTVQKHTENVKDFKITLSGNLWPCDCAILPFKTFLSEHRTQVIDISNIRCIFSNPTASAVILIDIQYTDLCSYSQYVKTIILLSSMGFIIVTVLITSLIFYYRHKTYILAFLYTHANPCYVLFGCGRPHEHDKTFDCFISYSSSDRNVALSIVEKLEDPVNCKFCIHERNWMSGRFITTNIIESIQNSRKTLIILSSTFLKSEWFHMEFQAAYHQTLIDKKDRLILVILGELPDKNEMETDLQHVISTKTYLKWGERWFWEKLRYSIQEENYFITRKKNNRCREILCFLCKEDAETEDIQLEEIHRGLHMYLNGGPFDCESCSGIS